MLCKSLFWSINTVEVVPQLEITEVVLVHCNIVYKWLFTWFKRQTSFKETGKKIYQIIVRLKR